MKASLAFLSTTLYLAHAADTVVFELDVDCIEPLKASAIDGNLSKDEYKTFTDKLIQNSSPLYDEIDVYDDETSAALDSHFDDLTDLCRDIFVSEPEVYCKNNSIHVSDGDDAALQIWRFKVCLRSFEFLNEKVRSEPPSEAPTIPVMQEQSFTNVVTAKVKKGLDKNGAGKQLEGAVENVMQEWISSSEESRDNVQFIVSVTEKVNMINDCRVKKYLSEREVKSFENSSTCYIFTIRTTVRISEQHSKRGTLVIAEAKKIVNTAFLDGVIQEILCPEDDKDMVCQIMTFVEKIPFGPGYQLATAFGIVGSIVLLMAYKTCNCKIGGKRNTSDDSSSEIEVEFPLPKLPREDEKIQLEQQTRF